MCQNNCKHKCTERDREGEKDQQMDTWTDRHRGGRGKEGRESREGDKKMHYICSGVFFAKYPVTHVVFRVHNPNF